MQPTSNYASSDASNDDILLNTLYAAVGGGVGLLASYPVNRYLFSVNPLAGFVSGFMSTSLFNLGLEDDDDEITTVVKLIVIVALQALATYAICLLDETPITFAAALGFPVVVGGVVIVALIGWGSLLTLMGEKKADFDDEEV